MAQQLADLLRPKTFDEILGQDKIKEIYKKMIEKDDYFSTILYGSPGNGKTTIASVFCEMSQKKYFIFNASIDNKQTLSNIIDNIVYEKTILLIVDEIHRMNKNIQDFLLPYVEKGNVILIGLTSENPYHSVNPAIRSRVLMYEVNNVDNDRLYNIFDMIYEKSDYDTKFSSEVKDYLVKNFYNDIRMLINICQACLIINDDKTSLISISVLKKALSSNNLRLDKNSDSYYLLLSGLQKSIRGSDVSAALYYASKLILANDIDSLFRRLIVICYEDIGLANPNIQSKVLHAYEACKILGMPESRIVISNIVIEMSISPKSNSAYLAIDKALSIAKNDNYKYPDNINNTLIMQNPNIYHYPHDDKDSINSERYIPDRLLNMEFYIPKNSSNYEEILKKRYEYIKKIKNIK